MVHLLTQALRNMLMDLLQLALGCTLPPLAGWLGRRGVSLCNAANRRRLLAICMSSLAGMVLPVGSFGAIPAVAALWLSGLDLPVALPLLVSNFLFNMSMPLTYAVFMFDAGTCIRIALAFLCGALSGLALSRSGKTERDIYRSPVFQSLFAGQKGNIVYWTLLRDAVLAAWPYILAAAALRSALSEAMMRLLVEPPANAGFAFSALTALGRLNLASPFFQASLSVFGRLADFSALASLLLLLKAKPFFKVLAGCAAAGLLLSVALFIR